MKRWIALAIVPLAMAACGDTILYLKPGEKLNPNQDNPPQYTTVRIRIYQLRDDAKFRGADFNSVWDDAKKELGEDLLGEPRVDDVFPAKKDEKGNVLIRDETGKWVNETYIKKSWKEEEIKPETRFFGVAALFQPEKIDKGQQAKWKAVVNRDAVGDWAFELDGYEVKLVDK